MPQPGKLRVAGIKRRNAIEQVALRLRQRTGGIARYRNRPAQRHRHFGRERQRVARVSGQHASQPIHPTDLFGISRRPASLENVLPIEVRAIAISRSDRVDRDGLLAVEHLANADQRGVQAEHGIETLGARQRIRQSAAQARKFGIAQRRHDMQAIGRPALDHEHEALLGLRRGEGHARREGARGKAGNGRRQERPAAEQQVFGHVSTSTSLARQTSAQAPV